MELILDTMDYVLKMMDYVLAIAAWEAFRDILYGTYRTDPLVVHDDLEYFRELLVNEDEDGDASKIQVWEQMAVCSVYTCRLLIDLSLVAGGLAWTAGTEGCSSGDRR